MRIPTLESNTHYFPQYSLIYNLRVPDATFDSRTNFLWLKPHTFQMVQKIVDLIDSNIT